MELNMEERREKRALDAEIEILTANLAAANERVELIEEKIKVYQEAQRPSQKHSIPPYDKEALARAKQVVQKNKERLKHYKSELRSLNARVAVRKKAEEKAEKARAANLPKIAEKRAEMVESISEDDLEIIFKLAKARQAAKKLFNSREQHRQDQVEANYLRSKGHDIPELRDPRFPTSLDELESAWKEAFDEPFEVKRTSATRKKASQISQWKGALRDVAAS
jgi:hypothetical protein